MLAYSSNGHNKWIWAKLKSEARISTWVSYVGGRGLKHLGLYHYLCRCARVSNQNWKWIWTHIQAFGYGMWASQAVSTTMPHPYSAHLPLGYNLSGQLGFSIYGVTLAFKKFQIFGTLDFQIRDAQLDYTNWDLGSTKGDQLLLQGSRNLTPAPISSAKHKFPCSRYLSRGFKTDIFEPLPQPILYVMQAENPQILELKKKKIAHRGQPLGSRSCN